VAEDTTANVPEESQPAPAAGEGAEAPKRRRRRTRKQDTSELNKVTQEATHASSEPGEAPAQTLSEADRQHATREGHDDAKPASAERSGAKAASEQPKAAPEQGKASEQPKGDAQEGQAPQPRRRRRTQQGRSSGSQNAQASGNGHGNANSGGNGNNSNNQHNFNQRNSNNRRRNRRGGLADLNREPSLTIEELSALKVVELRKKASEHGLDPVGMKKGELVQAIYDKAAYDEGFRHVHGVLDVQNEGYGFLRTGNYMQGDDDAYVYQQLIRQYGLRPGDEIEGTVAPSSSNLKFPPLARIERVNGMDPSEMASRPRFKDLTPIYPNERLVMEHGKDSITGRAIDLVAPIGKGQRGLIVSPPKAGKTTILKRICESIAANNPEVHLICLLVDERPEEVTDMQRSIRGEVVASTFDMPADNHTAVAELVIEHAKRLVELGQDVCVVLDSITRLARAYNLAAPASGRILSGGVDSSALYPPKRFLGAARNIENGGSLTILASALIDTGSKMDEVIFEEFKGTGNMELKLDRELADKRIFPAIDPVASGTRNEELLIDPALQSFVWGIRRVLANMNNVERAEASLVKSLKATSSNQEFLIRSAKKAQQSEFAESY
jgi:transcription termination factor Rho